MEKQEFFRQTTGRGLNLVRGLYNSARARRTERKAVKEAYVDLFVLFDRIFEGNPPWAQPYGNAKQTAHIVTEGDSHVILERASNEQAQYREHHIHWHNAAFYEAGNPDAKAVTIGLSQFGAEIIPRDINTGDLLNWADNPLESDSSASLTSAQVRDIYDWLKDWFWGAPDKLAKTPAQTQV